MYRVIDKRDTGKTRKLLEECAYSGGVFVCKHPDNIRSKCIAYGIDFSRIQYVYSYEDFMEYKSEVALREHGKIRIEGKEYIIQDGDLVHFRFNV